MDLEHRDTRLQKRTADLVRFLDETTALGDIFSVTMIRRLQGLAESRATLQAEKDICAARRSTERLRLRCAETIADAIGREARRIDDLRELERVIEASQQRSGVSSEQG